MGDFDYGRLKSSLSKTNFQKDNNPAYQVVYDLINGLQKFEADIKAQLASILDLQDTVTSTAGQILLRGTHANRPANNLVPVGCLYFETDNLLTFQNDGSSWVDYADSGGTGITQLTGDVTAGPGTGSQAATIANDAVTFAKMQNINTNKLLGRSTASSGDPEEIAIGSGLTLAAGTLSASGGGSGTTITICAYGSEPGSPSSGDLVYYNNAPFWARYNGSSWIPFYGATALALNFADTGSFTWLNQGSATFSNSLGFAYLVSTLTAGQNLRGRYTATSGTSYIVTLGFTTELEAASAVGVFLYESGTGKLSVTYFASNLLVGWGNLSSTTAASVTGGNSSSIPQIPYLMWIRIQRSGSTLNYYRSHDGINWVQIGTQALTTAFTTAPDNAGYFVRVNGSTGQFASSISVFHFSQV